MADRVSSYNILLAGNEAHRFGKSGMLKSKDGFSVFYANNIDEIEIKTRSEKIKLILIDEDFPDHDILDLAVKLRSIDSEMGIIYLTNQNGSHNDKLWRYGIDDLVREPCNELELKYRIQRALEMHRLSSLCTNLKSENNNLLTLSQTDGLTRLFNRRYFNEVIETEFARIKRYGGRMGCLMIDIDHFKMVNDNYGHLVGDQVLRQLSDIMRENVRTIDILARYGGEEFVMILPETGENGVEVVGNKLLSAVENHDFMSDTNPELPFPKHITVSIGGSHYPHPKIKTAENLLDNADQALYHAKNSGRNRLVLSWEKSK